MRKKTKKAIISAFTICIFVLALLSGTLMSQVEIPLYKVNDKEATFEIRQYPPLLVAQVETSGERKSSIAEGFKILAGYIFGNNQTSKRIAMTAPVIQEHNAKTAMPSPVLQTVENNQWKIRFVMPSEYKIKDLPKPQDPRIKIYEMPAKTYATIKFSGLSTQSTLDEKLKSLNAFIKDRNLNPLSSPLYAFYNPPWTLPFLRRNEIWIEVSSKT